jgi:hypothetical protein
MMSKTVIRAGAAGIDFRGEKAYHRALNKSVTITGNGTRE